MKIIPAFYDNLTGHLYLEGQTVWCLHCQKEFLAETVKKVYSPAFKSTFYFCPRPGCDGSLIDFFREKLG